jgi:hypothetical protein
LCFAIKAGRERLPFFIAEESPENLHFAHVPGEESLNE